MSKFNGLIEGDDCTKDNFDGLLDEFEGVECSSESKDSSILDEDYDASFLLEELKVNTDSKNDASILLEELKEKDEEPKEPIRKPFFQLQDLKEIGNSSFPLIIPTSSSGIFFSPGIPLSMTNAISNIAGTEKVKKINDLTKDLTMFDRTRKTGGISHVTTAKYFFEDYDISNFSNTIPEEVDCETLLVFNGGDPSCSVKEFSQLTGNGDGWGKGKLTRTQPKEVNFIFGEEKKKFVENITKFKDSCKERNLDWKEFILMDNNSFTVKLTQRDYVFEKTKAADGSTVFCTPRKRIITCGPYIIAHWHTKNITQWKLWKMKVHGNTKIEKRKKKKYTRINEYQKKLIREKIKEGKKTKTIKKELIAENEKSIVSTITDDAIRNQRAMVRKENLVKELGESFASMDINKFLQTLSESSDNNRLVHCYYNCGEEVRFAFFMKELMLVASEIGNKGLFPWSIDPTFHLVEGNLITIPLCAKNIYLEGEPSFCFALLCLRNCTTSSLFSLFMDINTLIQKWTNKLRSVVDVKYFITDLEKSLLSCLEQMRSISKKGGCNRISAKRHLFKIFKELAQEHESFYKRKGEESLKNFKTFCSFFQDPRSGLFSKDLNHYNNKFEIAVKLIGKDSDFALNIKKKFYDEIIISVCAETLKAAGMDPNQIGNENFYESANYHQVKIGMNQKMNIKELFVHMKKVFSLSYFDFTSAIEGKSLDHHLKDKFKTKKFSRSKHLNDIFNSFNLVLTSPKEDEILKQLINNNWTSDLGYLKIRITKALEYIVNDSIKVLGENSVVIEEKGVVSVKKQKNGILVCSCVDYNGNDSKSIKKPCGHIIAVISSKKLKTTNDEVKKMGFFFQKETNKYLDKRGWENEKKNIQKKKKSQKKRRNRIPFLPSISSEVVEKSILSVANRVGEVIIGKKRRRKEEEKTCKKVKILEEDEKKEDEKNKTLEEDVLNESKEKGEKELEKKERNIFLKASKISKISSNLVSGLKTHSGKCLSDIYDLSICDITWGRKKCKNLFLDGFDGMVFLNNGKVIRSICTTCLNKSLCRKCKKQLTLDNVDICMWCLTCWCSECSKFCCK